MPKNQQSSMSATLILFALSSEVKLIKKWFKQLLKKILEMKL